MSKLLYLITLSHFLPMKLNICKSDSPCSTTKEYIDLSCKYECVSKSVVLEDSKVIFEKTKQTWENIHTWILKVKFNTNMTFSIYQQFNRYNIFSS